MHTATRLALPLIDRVRALNPSAHVAAYGLYAPLNAGVLRERGVGTVLGPEFEQDLLELADRVAGAPDGGRVADSPDAAPTRLPRIAFMTPDRSDLPPLARYATLQAGERTKIVGYTEASRGCKHRCRHCPIVPVYDGRFRAVPVDVVLADIARRSPPAPSTSRSATPTFFNGPRHALALVDGLSREHPGVTYDVTIKVEHLRNHRDLLPRLRDTGCAFVTTAVESFDDRVLALLEKGHTRRGLRARRA